MLSDFFITEENYNQKLAIILQCDFLPNEHILNPIENNLINLRICNIPIIYFILKNLKRQGLSNLLICSKNEETQNFVINTIETYFSNFFSYDKFIIDDFNEMMRDIDDTDLDYDIYMLIPITQLTNLNLLPFIVEFITNRNIDKKIILHSLLFETEKTEEKVIYGFYDKEIKFYQRVYDDEDLNDRFYSLIIEDDTIRYSTNYLKPKLHIFDKQALAIFNENFDFVSFDDLIESVTFLNIYDAKNTFYSLNYDDLMIQKEFSSENKYFIEIDNLQKYYDANMFLAKSISKHIFDNNFGVYINNENIKNSFISQNSKIDKEIKIKNSVISDNVSINANIKNCLVLENNSINEDLENKIVSKNGLVLEITDFVNSENIEAETEKKQTTFFTDIFIFLKENKDGLISNRILISDLKKQINLITIVWNASNDDLIEAFTLFISDYIDESDLDQSTIDISLYFPLLLGRTDSEEMQINLFMQISENLNFESKRKKNEAMIRIGYALMDDGIVTKEALNKSKIMKKNFFQ